MSLPTCQTSAAIRNCSVQNNYINMTIFNQKKDTRACWSIKVWLRIDSGDSDIVETDSHFGAFVTLGCPASANQESTQTHAVTNWFGFSITSKQHIYVCNRKYKNRRAKYAQSPVFLCGPSPNKSLTTARALSERDSTSSSSSWSENTCTSETTQKNSFLFETTNNGGEGMLKATGEQLTPLSPP